MRRLTNFDLRFAILLIICGTAGADTAMINSFKGILTPKLDARSDIKDYFSGCRELSNMYTNPQGGATKRPGTYYIPIDSGTELISEPIYEDVTTYLGHVIVHNTYVDFIDPDFASVKQWTYTGAAATGQSLDMTSDGKLVVGNTSGIDYWDTDGNRDNTFFESDEGWGTIDGTNWGFSHISGVRFTPDDVYLYVLCHGIARDTLYMFEVSTGDMVWGIRQVSNGWNCLAVDSDNNVYAPALRFGVRKYSTAGNLVETYVLKDWGVWYDIAIDETNGKLYAVGWVDDTIDKHLVVSDWPVAGNYASISINPNGSIMMGVTIDSDGDVYAVGNRTQNGVGGTWASVYKYDSSLNLLASYDTEQHASYLWWDENDNLIVRGSAADNNLYRLDTGLNLIEKVAYTDSSVYFGEGILWQEIEYNVDTGETDDFYSVIGVGEPIRLISFVSSIEDARVIVLGDEKMGFLKGD